ncbi:phycobilisome linker polypeptide [Baaleninema sp.]|uniref:phycobilisome linker polypeptide n=1 Tax=Baaleninema sp. TaxID=3101197 RepID=UPI003D089D00
MMGSTAIGGTANTPSGGRLFRYEVRGLRQNPETDKNGYPIRSSDTVVFTVPYSRMNQEMQRITRMGGEIVKIEPVSFDPNASSEGESEG